MKNKKIIIYSVVSSILAHVLVIVIAVYVKIPGVYFVLQKTKQFFNVDKLMREDAVRRSRPRKEYPLHTEIIRFESPEYGEFAGVFLQEADKVKEPPLETPTELISEPVAISELEDELIEDESLIQLADERLRDTRADLVSAPEILAEGDFEAARELEEAALPEEFMDKMPGFTPQVAKDIEQASRGSVKAKIPSGAFIERKTDFTELTQYLAYGLNTYQDPRDGQKYYQLNIRSGKDVADIKSIPKEIIFLVDCSLSIQPRRLEQFKDGIDYCLRNLGPEDHFNIIAFKKQILSFRERPVKPDEKTIKEALNFVSHLTSEEGTDTYNALYKTIQIGTTLSPSYIILFSDGRSTRGVTNSREIINKISRFNNGRRPIFAFSGGPRVNRYFLDFIAYKNRGWSEHAYSNAAIKRHITAMFDKIKDPLFLNLRYRTSGLNEQEIFPRDLPDFFRNAELTLYGTYNDEDDFSLQFLGDSDDKTSEFLIVDLLEKADQGGEEIAKNWAFNKIYYLIGLLEYDQENEELIKEINLLAEKFDITTPYSEELQGKE